MTKGDLFEYKDMKDNPKKHKTPLGICLAPWGWNSHGEKMYKVMFGDVVDIVTEREINVITNSD